VASGQSARTAELQLVRAATFSTLYQPGFRRGNDRPRVQKFSITQAFACEVSACSARWCPSGEGIAHRDVIW